MGMRELLALIPSPLRSRGALQLLLHLPSAGAALLSFVLLLKALNLPFMVTIRRLTTKASFDATLLGSSTNDLLGLVLLLGVSLVIYWKGRWSPLQLIRGLIALGILIEGLTVIHFLYLGAGLESPLASMADLELQLFHSFGRLSTIIMLLILSFWLYRPLLPSSLTPFRHLKALGPGPGLRIPWRLLLSLAIALGATAPIYPYLSTVNPSQSIVSVDVPHYVRFLRELAGQGDPFTAAFTVLDWSDRALFLLFVHALLQLSGLELVSLVKFLPLLLGPSLALASFYLILVGTGDKGIASMASLLAVSSHYVVVGLYGGFFANWAAIILMMFYLAFLLKAKAQGDGGYSNLHLAAASSFLLLILFVHPYTWTPLVLTALLYFGLDVKRWGLNLKRFSPLFLLLFLPNLIADLAKTYWLGSVGGVLADYALSTRYISFQEFLARFSNLELTFTLYVGGFLSNPLLLSLTLLALLAPLNSGLRQLLASLIVVVSVPSLVGNYVIQSRLFYLLPFPLFAALVIKDISKRSMDLFLPFAIISSLAYLLRSLYNLPL